VDEANCAEASPASSAVRTHTGGSEQPSNNGFARECLIVQRRHRPMNIQDVRDALQVTNADLSSSRFADVSLRAAQFADVNLSQSSFTDIDFSGAKFSDVNLSHVDIQECDVTGMKINGILVSELLANFTKKP
jgi:uncharacterized protein YjbI with pentapeptide repeats